VEAVQLVRSSSNPMSQDHRLPPATSEAGSVEGTLETFVALAR